jgi:hypothetical protein
MPYFGKTPLTKNVSQFVQNFNTNLQQEMGLMYAPQNTQVNAVVAKMKEDAAYQQQKQQSIQKAMGSMIAADKGLNPADAAALAQMMAPKPTPQPTPKPTPSMMAPPTPMPMPMTGTGQTGGEVDPTTGQPFTFMPTPMGVEIDPSTGQPFMPPPPSPMPTPPMLPSTGPMGGELDPTTGLQFMPPPPLPPGGGPMGGELNPATGQPFLMRGDPGTLPIRPMGPAGFPDVSSWPGKIWGAAQDALSAYGEKALEGGGMKSFGTVPTESPFGSQVEAEAGITEGGGLYQEEMDAFQEEFRNPNLNSVDRMNLISRMLKKEYDKNPSNPEGLNMLSSILHNWLRDPTAVRGGYGFGGAPFDTNIITDIQPFLTRIKDYTAELIEIGAGVAEDDGVIPSDNLESVIAESEGQQPAVDGQSYLDWLSAVDSGKEQIYEYLKDTDPQFRLMSPYAESVYGKAEKQMRHQYNLESLDEASQWFGRSTETPEAANQNYLDYLKAAFSPSDRTANLWSREQWSDKLKSIYQRAFTDKGQTIVGNVFGGGGGSGFGTGAKLGEELDPVTTAGVAANAFREYARDPATVMAWIKAKSLKGANPIVSFYGPAAVERDVNKWLIENTPSMDVGDPTADPGGLGADLAAGKAAMSLFDEWASRDFQWFKKKGQTGQGYAAP